ncbi:MAG TPA: hypothetical protein VF598_06705 [Hymenobacter sp.]|jgi:hypothetical protein
MEVQLLLTTPHVTAYYDNTNKWLYLDWHGALTLDMVRTSCLMIARCFLTRRFKRILNDNTNVSALTPDVAPWLAKEYLPYMRMVGIEYVAWVYSPNMDVQNDTELALNKLSTPVVALFDDMATAYEWLSSVRFKSPVMLTPSNMSVTQVISELKNRIVALGGSLF